jgi:hypothetical protein
MNTRKTLRRRLLGSVVGVILTLGLVGVTAEPAQAWWWSYDEGWVAGKLFYYADCGGGRIVPVYAFWLNNTHYVHVTAGEYWSKRVGDRWGGNPYGSGC